MVHCAWNPLRKCQADGTEERTEIAAVRTMGTTQICPLAWQAGLSEPAGPSWEVVMEWGRCRAGPGSHEEPGQGLPLCSSTRPLGALCPFLSQAFAPSCFLPSRRGHGGRGPQTQLDLFKVAADF